MIGTDVREARGVLGLMWGLDRPLHHSELGRALRLKGKDAGHTVRDWERKEAEISGPVSAAIEMMLAGAMPPDPMKDILRSYRRGEVE
jgi:hypothetical protein